MRKLKFTKFWEFEPNAVRQHFVHVGHLFLQPLDHGNHLGKRFNIHILFFTT